MNAELKMETALVLRSMSAIAGKLIEETENQSAVELLHAIRVLGDNQADKLTIEEVGDAHQ